MCRLFGFLSSVPSTAQHWLLDGSHSLRALSVEHRHGWGIAHYGAGDAAIVDRGIEPACTDPAFERAARAARSRCIVAHVRRISVGTLRLENTHPFQLDRELFAHNGTVHGFEAIRPALEARLPPRLASRLRGDTDSERCFMLFLELLGVEEDAAPLERRARALARTIQTVEQLRAPGESRPHALTFLASDGGSIVAARAGEKELWYSTRRRSGASGAPHFVIASEPLTDDDEWLPIQDGVVVGVDSALEPRFWTMSDWAARGGG